MKFPKHLKQDKAESGGAGGGADETLTENLDEGKGANSVPAEGVKPEITETAISGISDLTDTHSVVYEGFDPAIHAVDADGKPKRKPNGEYAKKRGRKSGQTNPPTSGVAGSALPPKRANMTANAPLTDSAGLSSEAAARQFTNAFISGGVMIFGSDWEPEDKSEPQELKNALKDYFDADGVPNIPPWFGVALAFGAYSVKRLTKPTIMEKIGVLFHKVKSSLRGGVLL